MLVHFSDGPLRLATQQQQSGKRAGTRDRIVSNENTVVNVIVS